MPLSPPVGYFAVTTPVVRTVCLSSGLVAPVPWISAMVLSTGPVGGGLPPAGAALGVGAPAEKLAALTLVSAPSAARPSDAVMLLPPSSTVVSKVLLLP